MSALDSIIKWGEEDLLAWQSDAIRRLLLQEELSEADRDELLRMIKERHGIKDDAHPAPKPKPLKKGDVSGSPQTTKKVILKGLHGLNNINAIPDGSGLAFGHSGLTVIDGENGSGKSGYARVLKKACNARDTKEKLLANVYGRKETEPAQACIKYSKEGKDDDLTWIDGEKIDQNVLSNICVFDSKCARIIVDENNETTYLPYGATVFEEMVALYKDLWKTLEAEKPKPEKLEYEDIPASTKAGKFLSELTYETKDDAIEAASKWEEEDEESLASLKAQIAKIEADSPEKQAQRLRNLKGRMVTLADKINGINTAISEDKAEGVKQKIVKLVDAEKSLAIASQESLSGEPLPGAGEKVWQNLYNAARDYSTQVAYPGKEFPLTEEGSLCVLCMQKLEMDARARMLRFKEFMEKATKRDVDIAVAALERAVKELEALEFPAAETYKDIMDEYREKKACVVGQVEAYFPGMEARTKEIIQAAKKRKADEEFQPPKPSPEQGLRDLASKLEEEARELEKAAKPDEYERKKSQKAEMEARKLFFNRQKKVLEYAGQLRLARKYEECMPETDFTAVTKKGKKIITEALTPQLLGGLEDELKYLGAKHLDLSLKPSGAEGETKHKMELKGIQVAPKTNLSDILSEGEHCVVAVAGFLAELKVGNHECPIVFDDPVCSLDHIYREKIAKRLVEEAKIRQVIVFTHDIAFLIELESNAAESEGKVCFNPQTVCRLSGTVGKCIVGRPWHAMLIRDRIEYLREELNRIKTLYETNLPQYNREAAILYALLRETWEALVEESLLNNTIKRHGKEIQTQRLKSVTVETDDYKKIDSGMGKCSEWMLGHDRSKELTINRPDPKEIEEDIARLEKCRTELNRRNEALRKQREKELKPQASAMG
jgi:energy-coupling factor transporter ATP-binding protein EcfA2